MHPKTFHAILSRPFGYGFADIISFYVHEDTKDQAMAWVTKVFEGIKVEIEPRDNRLRVGNRDSVKILDLDLCSSGKRIGGKWTQIPVEPGHFRHSEAEVRDELLKVFHQLHTLRLRAAAEFESYKGAYERKGGWPQDLEALSRIQAKHELAFRWEQNVWDEYLKLARKVELVMPEPKAMAA